MYNDVEYNLQELGLSNLLYAEPKAVQSEPTGILPVLEPLLVRLAKARPNWKFFGVSRSQLGSMLAAVKFEVYQGDEHLGTIWRHYDYNTQQDRIAFNSRRLAAARQRGTHTFTKDVNKAFKLITKNFAVKDPTELVKDKSERIRAILSSAHSTARSDHHTNHTRLAGYMTEFALARWDEFQAEARASGLNLVSSALDRYQEQLATSEDAQRAFTDHYNHKGYTIVLRGSDYVISHAETINIVANDMLSDHLRRNIGLLKLANDGQYIPGIGVRADGTGFYVVPEQEEPNDA